MASSSRKKYIKEQKIYQKVFYIKSIKKQKLKIPIQDASFAIVVKVTLLRGHQTRYKIKVFLTDKKFLSLLRILVCEQNNNLTSNILSLQKQIAKIVQYKTFESQKRETDLKSHNTLMVRKFSLF